MSDKSNTNDEVETPSYQALEEAHNFMKEAYEIMKREAMKVRQEKDAFESVARKLEHVHFASTVKLNVGGQFFSTSLQTLTKDPGSMLHGMFSGRFDTKPAEDGSYFIDRDGTHFRFILNFLRTGRLLVPDDKLVRKELLEEAQFYQIRGIIDELAPEPFVASEILTAEQKKIMAKDWLKNQLLSDGSTFVLLYRASRDGWAVSEFHARCDNFGPTVTVVKSGESVFGGYTEQTWNAGSAGSIQCTKSFLFSLVNVAGVEPTKLPLKTSEAGNGIYYRSDYGPTFGGGHDLYISQSANANSNSYTNLGHTYECPAHITAQSFLAGSRNFTVNELEVFGYQE